MTQQSRNLGMYLNLLTDYAFKRIFGSLQNKSLLIDFINCVLEGEQRIVDLEYHNSERLGVAEEERRVIFDLLCENERGEKILIELQRARETWFKDRALYYAANLIQEQGIRGKWDYRLKPTYVIAILDFILDDNESPLLHRVALHDQTTLLPWSDRIQMVFLELPKFTKNLAECENHFERWLYLFRHMHHLERLPAEIQERVFLQLFESCEVGKFPEAERIKYQSSFTEDERMEEALKYARMAAAEEGLQQGLAEGRTLGHSQGLSQGLSQGIEQGLSQGIEQGIEKGLALDKIEVIENMLAKGFAWNLIQDITHLDPDGFEALKAKYKT